MWLREVLSSAWEVLVDRDGMFESSDEGPMSEKSKI